MSDNDLPVNMSRDFKGIWLPREIWLANGLNAHEKVLWAEIHSLYDREKGGCYASNEYLANFMGVKERTVRDALCKFRQLKLIEDVSFNGRERVIKAIEPDSEFSGRLAEWRKSAMQTGEKSPPREADSRQSHIYRDTSLDSSIDTPPIPPQEKAAEPQAAKAAEVILKDPPKEKPKRTRAPSDFTPKVKEVSDQMINALVRTKPDYVPPRNLSAFMTHVDYLLRLDNRDAVKLMDVFNWALADHFWCDKMFKPNPAEYLRKQFDQLEMKMKAKPAPEKRRFAQSSDDAKALEIMERMSKDAI